MKIIKGKGLTRGTAKGKAMVTKEPMNFTAAITKPQNMLIPGRWSQINDRHHELNKQLMKNKIFVYPATIGSTGTGMILLELIFRNQTPAGIIVENADTLMVSGPILADVWFGKVVPVVEYSESDLYDVIKNGDQIEMDGVSGEIKIF